MEKNGKGLLNIIGPGSVFEGTINVPHSIRIDGSFKGKVQTAESMTVGETGVVEAEIKGLNAFIFGKVLGNMYVDERVELHSTAVVVGDLHAKELVIKEGAIYHGHCSMQKGRQMAVEAAAVEKEKTSL
ncbi:MAG: polymer-forming cytoskeletal protein [Chitinispirillales bacterium]|jgi:cytoskeletal protein CcmA (bactofilin family)|nr:polymer-forming cytoskeletal protein [Chitinispirillales bacterium]